VSRVVRGGSFHVGAIFARCSHRSGFGSSTSILHTGCRVARAAIRKPESSVPFPLAIPAILRSFFLRLAHQRERSERWRFFSACSCFRLCAACRSLKNGKS
jgi:hypothetical protein